MAMGHAGIISTTAAIVLIALSRRRCKEIFSKARVPEPAYRVEGMYCAHCKAAVENLRFAGSGRHRCEVDLKRHSVYVNRHDRGVIKSESQKAGFTFAGHVTD